MRRAIKRLLRREGAQAALAWLASGYLAFVYRTTRWRVIGAEHAASALAGAPAIVAFWHERLALMPVLWRIAPGLPGARLAGRAAHVLISRHRDGVLIAGIIRRFGLGVLHGSTSRGATAGILAMSGALARGEIIAITPDGPRGPRRQAAPGVARLAAISGATVLACAASTSRRRVLGSWDRMLLPLPFGRGVICCSAAITVTEADWQERLAAIAAAMTEAAEQADRAVSP